MRYKEHRAHFPEGQAPKVIEFTHWIELTASETVLGSLSRDIQLSKFYLSKEAVEYDDTFRGRLIAEMRDGNWSVVGYLYGTEEEVATLELDLWHR